MLPKEQALVYVITILVIDIIFYFIFGVNILETFYSSLPLMVMWLIMYKVSDHIDIRYANIIVNIVIPFGYLIISKFLIR